jgi:DNA-binding HxlR family transcriptional regulator
MVLLDLLGERWTLRILWELRDGPLTFRALAERCDGVSPTILNKRLKRLREADLVHHERTQGYQLSPGGETLGEQLLVLSRWAEEWARDQ